MRTVWQIFLAAVVASAIAGHLRAENQQVQVDIQVLRVLPEGLTKLEFKPASNSGARLVPSSKSAPHCWFGEISEKEKCEWLRKLLADGHGKVLAEPRLVTFSGQPAKFLCGGQQAVLARLDDSKAPGVDFREVGTSVEVLPTIKNDQTLDLEVQWSLTKVNKALGIETSFGLVPGFTSSSSKTSLELHSGSTFVFCFGWEQINDNPATCSLIFITPHILPSSPVIQASVQELAHVQAGRIAAVLAAEYRQACTAGDKELAAKLGRMALQLDPLCFNAVAPPAPMPAVVQAMPVNAPSKRELSLNTPIMPPIVPGEPLPSCDKRPSEQEVLAALDEKSGIKLKTEDVGDDVEIVCEKLVDKIDDPRFYPLVGPAQLHHCHWKCTIYFTETQQSNGVRPVVFQRRDSQVVYIDKDVLHPTTPGAPAVVEPVASPEQPKKHGWLGRIRSFFKSNENAGITLPSGFYLQPKPQFFRPDPDFPLENELQQFQQESEKKQDDPPAAVKPTDENEKWIESLKAKQRDFKARRKVERDLDDEAKRLREEIEEKMAELRSFSESLYLAPFYVEPDRILRPAEMLAQEKDGPKPVLTKPEK